LRIKRRNSALSAFVLLIIIYLATGVYSVQNGQHALILRFGEVVDEISNPGLNYHLPAPIEKAVKAHIQQVRKVQIQDDKGFGIKALTGDENLILVRAVINYDINCLSNYFFNMVKVEPVIVSVVQMCICEESAKMTVDDIMTKEKSVLRLTLKGKIQEELEGLEVGVRVISIELTDISPPQNVSDAFKAVSNAREKKQRIIKEAEGYVNLVVPQARGKANSIISQAEAYAKETQSISLAKVKAFDAVLKEYKRNPLITPKLKYLETLEKILKECQIIIEDNPSQSTYYIGEPPDDAAKPDSLRKKHQ